MNDALKSSIKAFGTVTLPIAFNVGEQVHQLIWKILNVLLLVPIQSHLMMVIKISQLMLSLKSQPLIQVDICMLPELCQVSIRSQLFVAPQCENGYTSGTMGFSSSNGDVAIDCSNIHIGITKGLNDGIIRFHLNHLVTLKLVHLMEFRLNIKMYLLVIVHLLMLIFLLQMLTNIL